MRNVQTWASTDAGKTFRVIVGPLKAAPSPFRTGFHFRLGLNHYGKPLLWLESHGRLSSTFRKMGDLEFSVVSPWLPGQRCLLLRPGPPDCSLLLLMARRTAHHTTGLKAPAACFPSSPSSSSGEFPPSPVWLLVTHDLAGTISSAGVPPLYHSVTLWTPESAEEVFPAFLKSFITSLPSLLLLPEVIYSWPPWYLLSWGCLLCTKALDMHDVDSPNGHLQPVTDAHRWRNSCLAEEFASK